MSTFTELIDKYIAAKMTEQPGSYILDGAKMNLDTYISTIESNARIAVLDSSIAKSVLEDIKDILIAKVP